MSTSSNKKRLTITMPDDVVSYIDGVCAKTGMNRSGFIGMLLVEALEQRGVLPLDGEEQHEEE